MGRLHLFSPRSGLKTGILCKLLLFIGMLLLAVYLVFHFVFVTIVDENVLDSVLAFSIIMLGVGLIMFFFYCQFAKLTKIAEEIESEDSLDDSEDLMSD
jgi:hypothetical protein